MLKGVPATGAGIVSIVVNELMPNPPNMMSL